MTDCLGPHFLGIFHATKRYYPTGVPRWLLTLCEGLPTDRGKHIRYTLPHSIPFYLFTFFTFTSPIPAPPLEFIPRKFVPGHRFFIVLTRLLMLTACAIRFAKIEMNLLEVRRHLQRPR